MKKLALFICLLTGTGLPVGATSLSSLTEPDGGSRQLVTGPGEATECVVGDLYILSQGHINDFIAQYGHCTTIKGSLRMAFMTDLSFLANVTTIENDIEISGSPSLTSLSGLANLKTVGGKFSLLNVGVSNLEGLENLEHIGGMLSIKYMLNLTSLSGLSSLISVGGVLSITENPLLTGFGSLQSLASVGEAVEIFDNPALASFNGLQNLESVGQTLRIFKNHALTTINGLQNLTYVGGEIELFDSPALTSLNAFQKLTSVDGNLKIYENSLLTTLDGLQDLESIDGLLLFYDLGITSLDGLGKLQYIGGNLVIENNPSLTGISGFQSLTRVEHGLQIHDNPALTILTGFQNLASVGGTVSLYNTGIASLASLGKLESIGGGLSIELLPNLTSVGGLSGLNSVGTFINVVNNAALSTCALKVFCQKLADSPDDVGLRGNADGCASSEQVSEACATLPVALARFEVTPEGPTTRLSWATTSETNSDYFEIQHTTDAAAWNSLGRVRSYGESTTVRNYTFSHSTPSGGLNYYRLRMVDKDGTFEYSPIKSLRFEDSEGLVLYPNPAANRFMLKGRADIKQLEVFSITGIRVLTVAEIPSDGVDLSSLSPGQYTVKVTGKDGSLTSRRINIVK